VAGDVRIGFLESIKIRMVFLMTKPLTEESKLDTLRAMVRSTMQSAQRRKRNIDKDIAYLKEELIKSWEPELKLKGLKAIDAEIEASDYFYSAARRVWMEKPKDDKREDESDKEELFAVRLLKRLRKALK